MKARITASVGIGVLVAALGLDAIKQGKAESRVAFPWDFVVVDSTGKPIGPVIGTWQFENISSLNSGQTVAALPFQGKWLPVFVQRSSFVAPDLLFTSSDCTGQAFGDPSRSAFLATGVSANNTLYSESGASESITVQSIFDSLFGTCSTFSTTIDAVPMTPAIDLNVFTPPFSVARRSRIP